MKRNFTFAVLWMIGCCQPFYAQVNWQTTNGPDGIGGQYVAYNDQFAFYPDANKLYRTANTTAWEALPHGGLMQLVCGTTKMTAYQRDRWGNLTFWVSNDQGVTWLQGSLPPILDLIYLRKPVICSQGIFILDGSGLLYRSTDDALTWDFVPTMDQPMYSLWVSEDRLLVYTEDAINKIYRLGLNGVDWELVSPAVPEYEYVYEVCLSGPNRLIVTSNNIWASQDNGLNWSKRSVAVHTPVNKFFQKIGNRIYLNTAGSGLMFTNDFGVSWQSFEIVGGGGNIVGVVAGKLLFQSSIGMSYLNNITHMLVPFNEGLHSGLVNALAASANYLWGVNPQGIFSYRFSTGQWKHVDLPELWLNNYGQVVTSPSGKIVVKDHTNKLYLSQDEGLTWSTLTPYAAIGSEEPVLACQWVGETLYCTGSPGGYRSTDLGQTWQPALYPEDVVFFKGKYYGIGTGTTGFVSSSDGGLTWQSEQVSLPIYRRVLMATTDRMFLLGEHPSGFSFETTELYSTTDGIHWEYSNEGLPNAHLNPFTYIVNNTKMWEINGAYYYYEPSIGFYASLDTCKTWYRLSDNPNGVMAMANGVFYYGSDIGNGVLSTPVPVYNTASCSGVVFKDDNNNGIREANELALPDVPVALHERGSTKPSWFTTSQIDGQYSTGATPGQSDTLRITPFSPYVQNINPPLYLVQGNQTGRDFGVHFTENITDVAANAFFCGRPKMDEPLDAYVKYVNKGTLSTNLTFSIKLDPNLVFQGANPAPDSQWGADSLVWNMAQMPPLAEQQIQLQLKVNPAAQIPDGVGLTGYVVPELADFAPDDNRFSLTDTLVAEYKANEKRVSPPRGLTPAEILEGKELFYTIQFQNNGNAPVQRVRITDRLEGKLDASTARLVSASHAVSSFKMLPGALLEIVLDNIGLPDSASNPLGSRGAVTFAIQRIKTADLEVPVYNKASIYFDGRNPDITKLISVATHESDDIAPSVQATLKISPNPAQQYFEVETMGQLSGTGELMVVNALGQVCYRQLVTDFGQTVQVKMPLSDPGFYIVLAAGKKGVLSGKLIIQH